MQERVRKRDRGGGGGGGGKREGRDERERAETRERERGQRRERERGQRRERRERKGEAVALNTRNQLYEDTWARATCSVKILTRTKYTFTLQVAPVQVSL